LYRSVHGLRTETSAHPREHGVSVGLTAMLFSVSGSQTRGGRKGGLPVCECNGLLAKERERSPNSNGKTINEYVYARPKQCIGQGAINEQQPSIAFSAGSFLLGQQSMSSIEDDMLDIADDFAAAAAPAAVGSMATDRASKNTKMARPRCTGHPCCGVKIAYFRSLGSSDSRCRPRMAKASRTTSRAVSVAFPALL